MFRFEPHGQIDVQWVESVLLVKPTGQMNHETIKANEHRVDNIIAQSPNGNWCKLELINQNDYGVTPDVLPSIKQKVNHEKTFGLVKLGVVGCDVVMRDVLHKLCQEVGLEFEVYKNKEEGIKALNARAAVSA